MTDTLRCLFVDDRPGDLEHFRFPIQHAWDSLATGFALEFHECTSLGEALKEIQTNGAKYELFILDYYYPMPGGEPDKVYPTGQQLIDAAKAYKHAAIMVITSWPAGKPEALRHGAHAAVLKDDVQYGGTDFLAPELARATSRLNLQPTEANKVIEVAGTEVALTELVERIGRGHIQVLLQRLNRQPLKRATVSYVAPGFSGAAVLRADCQFVSSAKKLLLKVSRDGAKLADEIQNIPEAGQFPAGSFLRCEADGPHSSGGWYGIQALFDQAAVTLHERIVKGAIAETTLAQIEYYLREAAATTRRKDDGPIFRGFENLFTPSRRARAEVALKELRALIDRFATQKSLSAVSAIVERGLHLPGVPDKNVPSGTWFGVSHGDLHSRNILVTAFDAPRLIDASEVATRIWNADLSRLLVDIVLAGWMAGVDAYDWKFIDDWEAGVVALMRGDAWSGNGSGDRAWEVAVRLRANVFSVYPHVEPQRSWEFIYACAIEFLRSTYRQDLPAPKRALAALGAEAALAFAKESFQGAGITAL